MSYLDNYTAKLNSSGGSIHESITKNTEHYIQSKFKDSPTYRRATYRSRKDGISKVEEIDVRVISVRRMGSVIQILLRPKENLDIGNILEIDGSLWIAYEKYGSKEKNVKMELAKMNDRIKWRDKDGVINDFPCISGVNHIGSKSKQNRFDIDYNTYDVRLPSGQLSVFTEYNDKIKELKLNDRLIFGNMVYEIFGIDDVTMIDEHGYGVMQFTVKLSIEREEDDFENGIAYNKDYLEDNSEEGGGNSWGWT